jgi:hypothetical protein
MLSPLFQTPQPANPRILTRNRRRDSRKIAGHVGFGRIIDPISFSYRIARVQFSTALEFAISTKQSSHGPFNDRATFGSILSRLPPLRIRLGNNCNIALPLSGGFVTAGRSAVTRKMNFKPATTLVAKVSPNKVKS